MFKWAHVAWALGLLWALVGPAAGELTLSAETAAGTDNIAPAPVSELYSVLDGVPSVTLFWTRSPDDVVQQIPVGADFSSNGAFVNTNEVASYRVWRRQLLGRIDTVQIAEVPAGQVSYRDFDLPAGEHKVYTYFVAAVDPAGNESLWVESDLLTIGGPHIHGPPRLRPPDLRRPIRLLFDAELDFSDDTAVRVFSYEFRVVLARLLDIAIDRVLFESILPGSIAVTFSIGDISSDPTDDVIRRLVTAINQDPLALSVIPPLLGIPLSNIAVSPERTLDLGTAALDETRTQTFIFTNTSQYLDNVLTVSVSVEGAGFSVSPAVLNLARRETGIIYVSFDAATVGNLNGEYSGVLNFVDNNTASEELPILLFAEINEGLDPPIDREDGVLYGDFDQNGRVDFDDFFVFADNFGLTNFNAAADLDVDGDVDFDDFFIFADNFGKVIVL